MKDFLPALFCLFALLLATPMQAQTGGATIVETSSHSIFTGLFRSVWARLKAFNPAQKESAAAEAVYSAGIRGAESTDTLLKPYWKDDLTQDAAFQAELQKFSLAQIKMDRGELEAAVELFDGFLREFGDSALRPNAIFGKSLSLAGIGQTEQALAAMQQFIAENPKHPLVEDARQIIEELS